MNGIKGLWYPARSSTQCEASLHLQGENFTLKVNDEIRQSGSLHALSISDRTGNITRRISLPDESLFETDDNDAVDSLVVTSNHKDKASGVLHRLESSWRWVGVGVVVTTTVVFSFFKWGLPAASYSIAHALPVSVHESVAAGTLDTLDEYILSESTLDEEQREAIQARFDKLASNIDSDGFEFKLHFRDMFDMPNAFALPSGDIVVTDGLVKIANPPEELDAVILHELGHVVERHGLQHAIQASTMTLIVALAVGDLSGVGELVVSLPVFLMQSSYSRKSESGADLYAFEEMVKQDIDPKHFANIMRKFAAFGDDESTSDSEPEDTDKVEVKKRRKSYLSSHPDTEERALEAEAYSDLHFNAS